MTKRLCIVLILICVSGCAMPKRLEYKMAAETTNNGLFVVDNRPDEEKRFKERIDSDVSYFYGDDSFDVPLTEIFRNRLASTLPNLGNTAKVTVNKIVLAASINAGGIDERAYESATNPNIIGARAESYAAAAIARPIIGLIDQASSRRSIWCRIDYTVNGQESSERTVSSAKYNKLKEGIIQLYLETIDTIGEKLFQHR